jgi:bacillithiol biosynthesis deacetylase BshB1
MPARPMAHVDLLAFGAHPDDIEIGMGGTVAHHVGLGGRVGLCDLTAGEMGSNGTVDQRLAEADEARAVLGATWRTNLRLPDRALGHADHVRAAARQIRLARPRVVAIPYSVDRHPDHVAAHRLLVDAIFNAGLRRYDAEGEAWRPDWFCLYFINDAATPSFVVDVSACYETKRRALACHRSQFAPTDPGASPTRLTASTFQQLIESRDAQFGVIAGVPFAEGFVVRDPLVRSSLFKDEAAGARSGPA